MAKNEVCCALCRHPVLRHGDKGCSQCDCVKTPLTGSAQHYGQLSDVVPEDPVNHPRHYTQHPSGIECIEITRHMGFNLGSVMKYIWRADHKDGIQDLEKAVWYLKDEIAKRGG